MSVEIAAANLNSYQEENRPSRHARRYADLSTGPGSFYNPTHHIAGRISAALDPDTAQHPCRTLADMSEAEIVALEVEYSAKMGRPVTVKRPVRTDAQAVAFEPGKVTAQDCEACTSEKGVGKAGCAKCAEPFSLSENLR